MVDNCTCGIFSAVLVKEEVLLRLKFMVEKKFYIDFFWFFFCFNGFFWNLCFFTKIFFLDFMFFYKKNFNYMLILGDLRVSDGDNIVFKKLLIWNIDSIGKKIVCREICFMKKKTICFLIKILTFRTSIMVSKNFIYLLWSSVSWRLTTSNNLRKD